MVCVLKYDVGRTMSTLIEKIGERLCQVTLCKSLQHVEDEHHFVFAVNAF